IKQRHRGIVGIRPRKRSRIRCYAAGGLVPKLHADGSECREGTARVPAPFSPCCAAFRQQVVACEFDIRYEWWQSQDTWVIVIADCAGGGGVAINYCPHCGTKLRGSEKIGRYIEV